MIACLSFASTFVVITNALSMACGNAMESENLKNGLWANVKGHHIEMTRIYEGLYSKGPSVD